MRSMCSSTLLVEDKKVRVTRFDFESDQETGWHVHNYDYVITQFCLRHDARTSGWYKNHIYFQELQKVEM